MHAITLRRSFCVSVRRSEAWAWGDEHASSAAISGDITVLVDTDDMCAVGELCARLGAGQHL